MMTLTAMPKYETYKNSGSEFSGLIPSDWQLLPIRAIFDERNEKNIGPKTDFILSVTRDRGVIPYDEKGAIGNNKSEDIQRYKIVHPNDLVINKMNIVIGSLGLSKYHGALSQVYIVLKPKNSRFNIRYYSYLFSDSTFYKSMIKYCTGIMELRESLDKNHFKKINLPYPSEAEQTAIANFLDTKTAQIDEAIAIKEQQIALLNERKQILIQQAVTQGLDPTVPMKDSGVEWIGKIPEHWKLMSLRYAFDFLNNRRIPLSAPEREKRQGEYPYYGASGIIDYVDDYIYDEDLILIAEDGANLLSKSTPLAFVATGKYWVNNHAHIIKPKFKGFKYWAELLSGLDYTTYISGAAQPKLTRENLGSVTLTVPPHNEIEEITSYIVNIEPAINRAVDLLKDQINKLKEYKTTLINSAVTGRIKVV